MSADSNRPDKTVFRQPVTRGDGTAIRPVPGGRVSSGHTQMPPVPQQNQVGQQPGYTQQPAQEYQRPASSDFHVGKFRITNGLNPLVNAASMLLAVFAKTRQSVNHPNVGGLHQQLVSEIREFESRARDEGIKPEIILASRYILCTILDEAVLNTPWGAESAWTQRTLLSVFHNETEGGEKFFLILDRMRNSPAENLDVLELMYICISLGYEGKYRVVNRGREKLEQLRDEIFQIIRSYRGEYERSLSPSWHGLGKIRNTLASYVPMWVIASIVAGIMVLSYSGFRYWLHQSTEDVAKQLNDISNRDLSVKKIRSVSE